MKTRDLISCGSALALILFVGSPPPASAADNPNPAATSSHAQRLDQWRNARFGLFIHWGPVSLKGTEIGWSRGQQVPIEEYDNLYRQFNPTNFNAREWMAIAREAGMKYVVFTTKHHDGFCMFDTKQTDYSIMRSPFGRDVVKELSAAAGQEGLAFGTYYSVCDWHHPDFPRTSPGGRVRREVSNLDRYEQYLRAQVSELITNYGPLEVMWLDVPQEFDARRGQGLIDLARSLQPDILVNNRSGARGDYDTPEQRIGKFQMDRPWETCMTLCRQWAWKPNDGMKSLKESIQALVLCAGGDGNLLLNVGPMPDGRIEPRQAERLRQIGGWLAQYGGSIYGTRGGPWMPTTNLASTRKGNTVFVHVLRRDGDTLTLPGLAAGIRHSSVLTGGRALVEQTPDQVRIRLRPPSPRRPERGAEALLAKRESPRLPEVIDTIVRLELDRPALMLRAGPADRKLRPALAPN